MKEVKKCSISGVAFTMDADAYQELENYLDSLKKTYKDTPDGAEIVADIEARIAELILTTQDNTRVVEKPLILNIIHQMGSVEDISEESSDKKAPEEPRIPRRLYRDTENAKLGGVCAGLANYFDVDPTWIRLGMFAPLLIIVFGSIGFHSIGFHWLTWFIPFTSNLFGVFILGYIIMWFAVPPASSARQKLEMKGERITARSIRENTPATTAPDEPERTLLANVVSVFGKILLIILKIFVVLLLIGMVLGTTVLGFVMLCSIPLFAFDFVTGLAFLCFILVIIIPLIVLIYLSIMLLVTHKPSGGFLLTALILWIVLLAGMTVSAIKSPVRLQEQIENAFESAFSNGEDKLYDAFSEEEIADFHKKIGEEYDPDAVEHSYDDTLSDGVKSKVTFTLNGHTVNVITKADRQLIFYGSKHVNRCSESLLFDDGKTRFDISGDRTVIIEPNDEGSVKVTCDGESVECDTKVETDDAGATVTCSFSIDGVKVRYSCGPDVDSVDTTKEYVRDILGASSEIMDAAGEAMDAAGEAGKQATEAMQQAGEAMQQAGEAIQQAGEQIRKEIK